MLSLAVTGVLAGCRGLTAIWEYTTDLTAAGLRSPGVGAGRALPSESTIRRVLQDLDPADVDAHLRSWLCTRTGTINGRRVIAVDGKTMRGARTGKDPAPHLLAALDQATGAVLAQRRVAGRSNQRSRPRGARLSPSTWTGCWKSVPSVSSVDTGRGRRVRRSVKAIEAPARVDFPGAAQVVQLRRTRTIKSRKHVEVVHLICPLPMTDARPEVVAAWIQGHWGIESRLHWVRDVVLAEDRHQPRTGNGPQVTATLRNLAIGLIRLFHGAGISIASTTRSPSRRPKRPIRLLTQTPT